MKPKDKAKTPAAQANRQTEIERLEKDVEELRQLAGDALSSLEVDVGDGVEAEPAGAARM